MADGTPPPAVAVAEAVPQGSVAAGVVQGTAVGAPVAQAARTHARTVKAAGEAGPADSTVVAEAFVYTPFMARVRAPYHARAHSPAPLLARVCVAFCRPHDS